jgi:hypothetical protein
MCRVVVQARQLGAYIHALVALELQLQSTDRDDPVFAGPGPIGLKAESRFSESRFPNPVFSGPSPVGRTCTRAP